MLFATILTQVLSRTTNLLPLSQTTKVDAKVIQTQMLPVAACSAISQSHHHEQDVRLFVGVIHSGMYSFFYRTVSNLQ
jgi:hypothetical protein